MDDGHRSSEGSSAKKGLKSEVIVAVAAIAVSVMTLFVYIYQARIMIAQQHTSVWPHLEVSDTYTSTDAEQDFYFEVSNKGVGPALVKQTKLTLDGKPYANSMEMLGDLLGEKQRDSLWILYSSVSNRVLAPGDQVKIFHIKNWKGARIPNIEVKRIRFTVCYCSIYDDCWSTDGTEGECALK